ncbi:MAG: hypothetical protein C0424_12425 [Sphingobacteriaceae bacterium]|nr:hypothetical protein [Sphingobacteriaceae bacterium]
MGDCLTSSSSACSEAETAIEASGTAACMLYTGIKASHNTIHKKPLILFTPQKYCISNTGTSYL